MDSAGCCEIEASLRDSGWMEAAEPAEAPPAVEAGTKGLAVLAEDQEWHFCVVLRVCGAQGTGSRRRDCHPAAPPSIFSRCFNREEQGASGQRQSRRRLGGGLEVEFTEWGKKQAIQAAEFRPEWPSARLSFY